MVGPPRRCSPAPRKRRFPRAETTSYSLVREHCLFFNDVLRYIPGRPSYAPFSGIHRVSRIRYIPFQTRNSLWHSLPYEARSRLLRCEYMRARIHIPVLSVNSVMGPKMERCWRRQASQSGTIQSRKYHTDSPCEGPLHQC